MSAFPPNKTRLSLPVSQEIALEFLTSYLDATKTTPYLLPNARLEPNGVTAISSSSILIHNLERVQAGLRGEWLAPVLELGEDGEDVPVAGGLEPPTGDDMNTDDWQDLGEYQREQSIEEGESEQRLKGVAQEGDSDFEGADVGEEEEEDEAPKAKKIKTAHGNGVNDTPSSKAIDKAARKQQKKLKLKQDKKKKWAEKESTE